MRCARPAVSRAPRGTLMPRSASLVRAPQQACPAIRTSPLLLSPRQSSLPSATPLFAFRAFRSSPPSRVALAVHEPVQPAIISDNNYVNVALLFGAAAVLLWLSTEERAAAEEVWSKDGRGIVEPNSGLTFAPFIQRVEAPRQDLVAFGVRKVWYVQTYALGVYVDTKNMLIAATEPFDVGAILSELTDPDTVRPIPFELTLRLVPVRNTNSSHFSSAFVAALRTTLKNEADLPLIDGFKSSFPSAEFPRGTEIDISWKGGDIVIRVNGKKTGEMHNSQRVGAVLLGLYLGEQGKTPALRKDFFHGMTTQRWTQWKQT